MSDALCARRRDGQPAPITAASRKAWATTGCCNAGADALGVVDGYLKPTYTQALLRVEYGAHVTRLVFEGEARVGVLPQKMGRNTPCDRETILCMGAVGRRCRASAALRCCNRSTSRWCTRLQVGENYIDHFATRMNWRVKGTVTLNECRARWPGAGGALHAHTGILTRSTGLVHGFVKNAPDLQFFFVRQLC